MARITGAVGEIGARPAEVVHSNVRLLVRQGVKADDGRRVNGDSVDTRQASALLWPTLDAAYDGDDGINRPLA